jgi:hypothetical protein
MQDNVLSNLAIGMNCMSAEQSKEIIGAAENNARMKIFCEVPLADSTILSLDMVSFIQSVTQSLNNY